MPGEAKEVNLEEKTAIIIPIFGRHDLTRNVLADLSRDGGDYHIWLIDNRGDFNVKDTSAQVLRPGTNLGWARGCNFGVKAVWDLPYEIFVLLNNDVRLSRLFIRGLLTAMAATGTDVVGPLYDHNWPHQRGIYLGEASHYPACAVEHSVPFIDGTCMLVRRLFFEEVGFLDELHWPKHGWGCDKDYAIRVRARGGSICVTERSYLNHLARQTALTLGTFSELEAEYENDQGMAEKWGPAWLELLYKGFPGMPRSGLVQDHLASRNRTKALRPFGWNSE